jgi:predicted PurR-regulated permease PerM
MEKITSGKIALWTATILLVMLGFVFLWLIRNILFLLFLSILFATGIEPVVRWLRRGPFTRSTGILAVYSLIMGAFALLLYLTIPPLVDEANRLIATFTNPDSAKATIAQIDNGFMRDITTQIYNGFNDLGQNFKLNANTLSIGVSVLEALFSGITVFVIAFYWLTERTMLKRFIFSLIPEQKRPNARTLWINVEDKLGAWTRGQLLLMVFIGVLAGVGYMVMGLKYALVLAVFAGLTELIPLVGPYIGGAPAVLIALTQNVVLAIVVAVYILVLQLVEGNVLVPRIMKNALGVTPLTVIIGILIGSTLAGIAGALVAVPIAATIQVIFTTIQSNNETVSEEENAISDSSPEKTKMPDPAVIS